MTTAKVETVQGMGDWTSPSGAVLYKFEYTLDDGTVGLAFHQSDNAKFMTGDEVEFEVDKVYQDGSKKLRLRKPGGQSFRPSPNGRGQDPKQLERIERSWAMGQAVSMCGVADTKDSKTVAAHMLKVCQLAEVILKARDTFPKFDAEDVVRAKWDSQMADGLPF
jgi:hypothetical protein